MEKITEAINRINILKLNNDVITNLQAGIVLMSDENGEICALDKGAKEAIEAIKGANVFVYHVLKTNSSYGLIYSMLYVSNNEDEWEYERPEGEYVSAFCYNATIPDYSEFGDIFYKVKNNKITRSDL